MDVLCNFKFKLESPNSDHGCVKGQWPYSNQDQDAKPQSGTSSILQSPKWWLKGHGCSLHLQIHDRGPKFGSWVYQRLVTIFKSRSRCQATVRKLQLLPKSQIRTWSTWMFFAPSKSRSRAQILNMVLPKTSDHIQIRTYRTWMFLAPSKSW